MSDRTTPWHLWVVGMIALVWNGFGAADYTMTQLGNRDWFAMMGLDEATTDAALAFVAAQPAWMTAVWALGVWFGLAGAVLLLAGKRLAVPVFAISFVGAVGAFIAWMGQDIPEELGEMGSDGMMYVVVTLAAFLLWYAWTMRKQGVLA